MNKYFSHSYKKVPSISTSTDTRGDLKPVKKTAGGRMGPPKVVLAGKKRTTEVPLSAIVVTTGIKPSSTSPLHLCWLCTGGAVSQVYTSGETYTSANLFDTLVTGVAETTQPQPVQFHR